MADERKKIFLSLIGESKGMDELNRKSKVAEVNMAKLAHRAALVIPLWVALRGAMLALPRAILSTTKEWLAFQSEMSRVATVTRTTTDGMEVLEDRKSVV